MDFIYQRLHTPQGVKIETVTGGERYKGKVWLEIARQIYCENGRDGYREIGHYRSGAPFLYGEESKISISHTSGCFAVATIPSDPETPAGEFSPATALGIDVERMDREKVMNIRDRFLNPDELKLVSADSVEENIIAWTCKEAMLKAGMDPEINWVDNVVITTLPSIGNSGKGFIILNGEKTELSLYSMKEGPFVITVAH